MMRFSLFALLVFGCTSAFAPSSRTTARVVNIHATILRDAITEVANGEPLDSKSSSSTVTSLLRGCQISRPDPDNKPTDYEISIDGVEADLGRFSEQMYRKCTTDAKRQNFQGFRPGTIPPHLLNTYKTFAMDETGRETIMEAMTQNKVSPFERTREEIAFTSVSFVPPLSKKKKKKKKTSPAENADPVVAPPPIPLSFDSMDNAVKGGWSPGIPFSFTSSCKGQPIGMDVLQTSSRKDGLSAMFPTERTS
ncbi:hypothetical protein TrLO_g7406 [Triparma laevis f. longispina]|uniref:Uncharacterized protein n=2 Tax=Triparma laevis TaxID=1534972 RepID=A0A9W7F4S3_9STRA|nr:hypothetical protein TrLO_g7406 [Triparma laevis f. longispina]